MSNKSEKEMALERLVVLLEKILEKYAEQVEMFQSFQSLKIIKNKTRNFCCGFLSK